MIFKAGGLGMQVKGQRRGSSENENTENPVIYNQVTTQFCSWKIYNEKNRAGLQNTFEHQVIYVSLEVPMIYFPTDFQDVGKNGSFFFLLTCDSRSRQIMK